MDAKNAYINDNDFVCNLVGYERNEKNGKFYKYNLLANSFFGRMRRKVSKEEFEERRDECLKAIAFYEQNMI